MHFILTQNLFSSLYLMKYPVGLERWQTIRLGTAEPLRQKESPNLTIVPSSFQTEILVNRKGVEKNVNCLWKYQRIPIHSRMHLRFEPENHPVEQENHLWSTSYFFGSMENFQGSSWKKVLPKHHFVRVQKSRQSSGWLKSSRPKLLMEILTAIPAVLPWSPFSPSTIPLGFYPKILGLFYWLVGFIPTSASNTTVSTETYQNQKMIHGIVLSWKFTCHQIFGTISKGKDMNHLPNSHQFSGDMHSFSGGFAPADLAAGQHKCPPQTSRWWGWKFPSLYPNLQPVKGSYVLFGITCLF